MLPLPTFFEDFLKEIRPTPAQRSDYRDGHRLLRKRLKAHDDVKDLVVTTFLQGSLRRATAKRGQGDERPDVDLVAVTEIPQDERPDEAMTRFESFLDQYYAGKWSRNDRSFCIELSKVKLDLVITSKADAVARARLLIDAIDSDDALDEVERWDAIFDSSDEDWRDHPIFIPDRRADTWEATNPLAQIRWTWLMNRDCNGHFVNVVKVLKWWRARNPDPQYPKSYPFEHLIGACCPRNISSVAEGVTRTLEAISDQYRDHAERRVAPELLDHGVDQNVMERVSGDDFAEFHALVEAAAALAREALDGSSKRRATELWRELLGDRFPLARRDDSDDDSGGFSKRTGPTVIGGARYA